MYGDNSPTHECAESSDALTPAARVQIRIDPTDGAAARALLAQTPELASRVQNAPFANIQYFSCDRSFPAPIGGVALPGAPYMSPTASEQVAPP